MSKGLVIRKANLFDASAIQKCVDAAYGHYITRIGKPPGPMLDDYTEVIQHHEVADKESNAAGRG